MAKERTCARTHQKRARAQTELCIRVPICGKTPQTIDGSLRGEKRPFALMGTKVPRHSRAGGATRRALHTTGPRCAGSPSARPARTPPPKTQALIPLAPSPPVKIRTEAIALRYRPLHIVSVSCFQLVHIYLLVQFEVEHVGNIYR